MSSAVVSTVTVDIFQCQKQDRVQSTFDPFPPAQPVLNLRELEVESKSTKFEV